MLKAYIDKDQEIKDIVNPVLCCPEVANIDVEVFPGCTNDQCAKPVTLTPGAKIVTSHHCKCTMRSDKCNCVFHCIISFDDKNLKLPLQIISSFLQEDIIEMWQRNIDTFKEKLLFMENVDYTYNTKNVITAMNYH